MSLTISPTVDVPPSTVVRINEEMKNWENPQLLNSNKIIVFDINGEPQDFMLVYSANHGQPFVRFHLMDKNALPLTSFETDTISTYIQSTIENRRSQ